MNRLFTSTAAAGLLALGTVISSPEQAKAVTFGTSFDDGLANSLQQHLDDITVSGSKINTVGGQTGYELFTNTASSGSIATLMFEFATNASTNKFGIYNQSGAKAELFGGINDVSDGSTVNFLDNGDISVSTKGYLPGNTLPTPPSYQEYKGFGNVFGFYLETKNGTFFTQSALNTNGSQQAVIYQGNNQTQLQIAGRQPGVFTDNEYIIAFEELLRSLPGNSDSDFQDFVVMVESIKPARVPEPDTATSLLAFGLLGSGWMLKRQHQKNHHQISGGES